MQEMTTIKVEAEARDTLRQIAAITKEKQYVIVSRLVLKEKARLRPRKNGAKK